MANPDIVILDEPFSGLDPVNSQILKDVVSELITDGKLVIFSSHQMSYVEEFCDNIAIINQGEVVLDGRLKEIKKEYGRDRLVLAAANYEQGQLAAKLEKGIRRFCDSLRPEERVPGAESGGGTHRQGSVEAFGGIRY